jgi:Mrp family chromosome partitioning ATPase
VDLALFPERVTDMIRRARQNFDFVVIDAPAALLCADARVLASHADGAILVLRAGQTDQRAAAAAAQRFWTASIPVLGTILNDWDGYGASSGYERYRKYYATRKAS